MTPGSYRQLPVGGAAVFSEGLDEGPVGVLQPDRRAFDRRSGPCWGNEPADLPLTEVVRDWWGRPSGGEQMEDAVGLEGRDVTVDGEPAEQQRGGLFAVAGVNRAEDLGLPELSSTQAVSGCSASLVATTGAAPGAQRMRIARSDWPSRCESSWPTTRTT